MARITQPLTNTEIEKAKPKANGINKLFDGNGLQLRVKQSGSKIWVFDYQKPFAKNRTTITLGHYPDLSLSQARNIREEYRVLLAQNIDPKEHRDSKERKAIDEVNTTFKKIAIDWLEWRATRRHFDETTKKQTLSLFNRYVFERIGHIPVKEVKPKMVIELLEIPKNDGKHLTVKRIISRINEVMTYCLHREMIETNNCLNLSKEYDNAETKHYPTIKPEEVKDFFKAFYKNDRITEVARQTLLWHFYCMTRPTETSTAMFKDIDEKDGIWSVLVKKGNSGVGGRIHKVTLSKQALKLLDEIKERINNDGYKSAYLFGGRMGKPRNKGGLLKTIVSVGYKGKLSAHGVRSIASTYLNEKRYHKDLVEVALSHLCNDQTRMAYNNAEHIEDRREMLQDWADYIESCINQAKAELKAEQQ